MPTSNDAAALGCAQADAGELDAAPRWRVPEAALIRAAVSLDRAGLTREMIQRELGVGGERLTELLSDPRAAEFRRLGEEAVDASQRALRSLRLEQAWQVIEDNMRSDNVTARQHAAQSVINDAARAEAGEDAIRVQLFPGLM